MLELFAGKALLRRTFAEEGFRVGPPFEFELGSKFDLTQPSVQNAVFELTRRRRVWYVHLGTPYTIWSIARTVVADSAKNPEKECIGVVLVVFSVRVA